MSDILGMSKFSQKGGEHFFLFALFPEAPESKSFWECVRWCWG